MTLLSRGLFYSSSLGPAIYSGTRNKLGKTIKYSTTSLQFAPNKGVGDIVNDGNVNRVEVKIEEAKQRINDIQTAIEKVETEIEARKKHLLDAKLSPFHNSIHTMRFDSLIEEKKALIDMEKILMDMKNARITNFRQETAVTPFEFTVSSCVNFPYSGGGEAIFKREWLINDIADMVLARQEDDMYNSYYWRAPASWFRKEYVFEVDWTETAGARMCRISSRYQRLLG